MGSSVWDREEERKKTPGSGQKGHVKLDQRGSNILLPTQHGPGSGGWYVGAQEPTCTEGFPLLKDMPGALDVNPDSDLIHSFHSYLLFVCYVPSPVCEAEHTQWMRLAGPQLRGAFRLLKETEPTYCT